MERIKFYICVLLCGLICKASCYHETFFHFSITDKQRWKCVGVVFTLLDTAGQKDLQETNNVVYHEQVHLYALRGLRN
ncbi:hypothetical protein F4777DRAFT_545279 [Nemania sp. FL0916]|nr:hypothetical protein F4777DRAFT_545279 [Nemania sp. FL0916]